MAKIRNLKERSDEIIACLTCVLCNHFFMDATKIIDCFHTFCRKCIFEKFMEEDLECCPVCKIHLGVNPYDRLRSDFLVQDIRNNAVPIGKEDDAREHLASALSQTTRKKAKVDLGDASGSYKIPKSRRFIEEEEEDSDSDVKTASRFPRGHRVQENVYGPGSIQPMAVFYDHENRPSNKKIWFTLVASEDQEGDSPLRQIEHRYVRMKDGSVPVLYICKYLMETLNLESENEVEIKCMGIVVSHEMRTDVLSTMWLQEVRTAGGWRPPNVGPPEDEYLKVLNYGRKVQSP